MIYKVKYGYPLYGLIEVSAESEMAAQTKVYNMYRDKLIGCGEFIERGFNWELSTCIVKTSDTERHETPTEPEVKWVDEDDDFLSKEKDR